MSIYNDRIKNGISILLGLMFFAMLVTGSAFAGEQQFEDSSNTTIIGTDIGYTPEQSIKIGVLAERGVKRCREKWEPTVEYLGRTIQGYTFELVPMDSDEIFPAVEKQQVDFVLVNSSYYVQLEMLYGVSRLATLKNLWLGKSYTNYAGVIFTRADREDIKEICNLKDKTFMAVDEQSFGGWQMAWYELKVNGIDPHKDFASLSFGGTHDAVVHAVRNGKVDAGTVRSDTLEDMETEGKIKLADFHVIRSHDCPLGEEFPFVHSTHHYPEWPMANLKHTSISMAEKVLAALLNMPADSAAAKAANCTGWTVPNHYQSVHNCLKKLHVGPYKDYGKVTVGQITRQYWSWLAGIAVLGSMIAIFTFYTTTLNARLRQSITDRKKTEEAITTAYEQLKQSNMELKEVQSQLVQNEKLASIGQLAAGVAHEMNTPVGFVAGNFQTLESHLKKILGLFAMHDKLAGQVETSENPQIRTIVDGIGQFRDDMQIDFILEDIKRLFDDSREGLDRTIEIIQNLRDFSRIDQPGSRDECDLNEGIKSTLVVAGNEIKYDADVKTEFSELPLFFCHSGQINQVLLNILVNASQAIKSQERDDRGTITIRTYASDDGSVCEISDDGPGIPPDILSKIFDPFFTTKPPGKGTGLGLSVSYGIVVNKHNGELLVDSTVGEGTKFTIKLPIDTKENDEKEIMNYGKENSVICG